MITTTTPIINLGDQKAGSDVPFTFNVSNNGTNTLNLTIKPGCGCTKPSKYDKEMKPLSIQFIKAEIHLSQRLGEFNKVILVTDINTGNSITINVKGNVL